MNTDRTIRTDRRASLSLEGQWHGPGRVANGNTVRPPHVQAGWHLSWPLSPDFTACMIALALAVAAWVFVVRVLL